MGRMGNTGQCSRFSPFLCFLCDILSSHPLHRFRMRDGATERSCCQSSLVRWSLGLAWQAIYSLFYRSFLISGQQKHGENVSEGAEWGGVGWAGDLLEEGRVGWLLGSRSVGGAADYYIR